MINFKKIILTVILCVTAVNLSAVLSLCAVYQSALGRVYTLETTYNPDNYVHLTAKGDTVYAEGYYKGKSVKNFTLYYNNAYNTGKTFNLNPDGSFSASYSGKCPASFAYAAVEFADGGNFIYRIEYNGGWFFGDNGLAEKTGVIVENYSVASPDTNAYYVSPTLDLNETGETLDGLRGIVNSVTAGLDDDYQKAAALNDWVSYNIFYDTHASETEVDLEVIAIASTLKRGRSVCIGIANFYGALLEAAGIKAVNIRGGVVAGDCSYEELAAKTVAHEWVAFWYEKESRWVYTDPTWDLRKTFNSNTGKYDYSQKPPQYFDISPLALSLDHRGDKSELREYFSALEYIQKLDGGNPEPPDISVPQIPISETSANPVPQIGDAIESGENNTEVVLREKGILLYAVIGAMTLTAAGLIVVIVKLRK